jgi:hypothetical protein
MWIAVTEDITGKHVLINTMSPMRITAGEKENTCDLSQSEYGLLLKIKSDFGTLVLSLQALDLRQ